MVHRGWAGGLKTIQQCAPEPQPGGTTYMSLINLWRSAELLMLPDVLIHHTVYCCITLRRLDDLQETTVLNIM